jgi:NAD-dependent deacetylase
MIWESEHIVFLGDAGVSTESGIPDFRSKDSKGLIFRRA